MQMPPGPQMAEGPVGQNAHAGWQMPMQMGQQGRPDIRQMLLQRLMMRFQGGHFPQQGQMLNPQMMQQYQQAQQQQSPWAVFHGQQMQQQAPQLNQQMQQQMQAQMQAQPQPFINQSPMGHLTPAQLQSLVAQISAGRGA